MDMAKSVVIYALVVNEMTVFIHIPVIVGNSPSDQILL